jgi:hypothetical protein
MTPRTFQLGFVTKITSARTGLLAAASGLGRRTRTGATFPAQMFASHAQRKIQRPHARAG